MRMRSILQHISRSVLHEFGPSIQPTSLRSRARTQAITSFVCIQCRLRASQATAIPKKHSSTSANARAFRAQIRQLSTSARLRREDALEKPQSPIATSGAPVPPKNTATYTDTYTSKSTADGSTVNVVPDEELPSHQEQKRWRLSKRFNQIMDDLMPKLALASQRINNYTGTDYSGIEALRKEITEQENLVKLRVAAVQAAKDALEVARAQESLSRKEVVGLLERKHAWSDADLERYMNLIRSEHLNEQGVQGAKDSVAAAEMSLEEARTRLEKRERMQYHEEQIWSDTIRRNSTWVTFGLMGVNILLLLATLVVIEPWRRRRLVREIRRTLEENQMPGPTSSHIAKEIEAVAAPKGIIIESIELLPSDDTVASSDTQIYSSVERPPPADSPELPVPETSNPILWGSTAIPEQASKVARSTDNAWSVQQYGNNIQDLFSNQSVVMRKLDITTVALGGAATGAALMGLLMVMLRPR